MDFFNYQPESSCMYEQMVEIDSIYTYVFVVGWKLFNSKNLRSFYLSIQTRGYSYIGMKAQPSIVWECSFFY